MDLAAETGATLRIAARVILMDQHDTVLHIGGGQCMDGVVRWFIPGGGIDPDESLTVAAAREIAEETGLEVDPETLGRPVAYGIFTAFPYDRLTIQKNWYFSEGISRIQRPVAARKHLDDALNR